MFFTVVNEFFAFRRNGNRFLCYVKRSRYSRYVVVIGCGLVVLVTNNYSAFRYFTLYKARLAIVSNRA